MKLGQIVTSQGCLNNLINQRSKKARVTFKLAGIVKAIGPELENYETARKALCENLGTLNPDKTAYEFNGNREQFEREHQELIESEVTLTIQPLTLDELEAAELSVSAGEILALSWMISE